MAIPQNTIDSIRERADIVEVVGQYVELKRAGVNFKGLCPFHQEKTPSFVVSPEKQIYHCFGCGQGGNVFNFIMEMDGVTFPEAVRELGRQVGVEVEEVRGRDDRSQNDAFFEANRFAARFYHRMLNDERAGAKARAYLEGRGIPREAWTHFGLGASPDSWDRLWTEARRAGIDRDALATLRLIVAREKGTGYYDYFRDRLMFPIVQPGSRVVGFGARALAKDAEPKYLNSAESPIFAKRRTFYGMDRARDAIRKKRQAIVVEGYTDLISVHLAGFENCVASCGTALTPEHATTLRRVTQRVLLLPDGDSAGETAAMVAGVVLLGAGLEVDVVQLPKGADPDSAAQRLGKEKFAELIGGSMDYFAYLGYIVEQRAMSARDQEALVRRLASSLGHLEDPLRYDVIAKEIARVFNLDPSSLRSLRRSRKADSADGAVEEADQGRVEVERLALRLVMEGTPVALQALDSLDSDDFSDENSRNLYKLLDLARESRIDIRSRDFQRQAEEAGLEGVAAEIALISVPPGNVETLLKDTVRRIKKLRISDELAGLRERLLELPPDSEEAVAVAEYYHKLKQALVEL